MSFCPECAKLQTTLREQFNAARKLAEAVVRMDADKAQLQTTISQLEANLRLAEQDRDISDRLADDLQSDRQKLQEQLKHRESSAINPLKPQGGNYRPHYRKRDVDAFIAQLQTTLREQEKRQKELVAALEGLIRMRYEACDDSGAWEQADAALAVHVEEKPR